MTEAPILFVGGADGGDAATGAADASDAASNEKDASDGAASEMDASDGASREVDAGDAAAVDASDGAASAADASDGAASEHDAGDASSAAFDASAACASLGSADPIHGVSSSAPYEDGGIDVMTYAFNGQPHGDGDAPAGATATFRAWTTPADVMSSMSVMYFLDNDAGAILSLPMTLDDGADDAGAAYQLWTASFTAQSSGTGVTWWVQGTDVLSLGNGLLLEQRQQLLLFDPVASRAFVQAPVLNGAAVMLPHEKLESLARRYVELDDLMCQPHVLSDRSQLAKLTKERSDLAGLMVGYEAFKAKSDELVKAKELLDDPDFRELAQVEIASLTKEVAELEASIRLMLLPKDPNDAKNTILEIRSGEGGEEAALFAADLFRMYARFAETRGWRIEILTSSESATGGYKEVIALVVGKDVYSQLRFEGGVHRVQRVPATETQGRIHTFTATVAVLPEAEDVDVTLDEKISKSASPPAVGRAGRG